VLLVEKSAFPRDKVCGCCVNERAAAVLRETGVGDVLETLRANPIRSLTIQTRAGASSLRLPPTRCVSRAALDQALVAKAGAAGASVTLGAAARVGDCHSDGRRVSLDSVEVRAGVVLCAAGLRAGGALPEEFARTRQSRHARIGLSTIVDHIPGLGRHELRMVCATHGYVGMSGLEDGRIDVAAAVDPRLVQSASGPGEAIGSRLAVAGADARDALAGAHWMGTPPLTHRRNPAGERLLLIGDAARYVEPFTGEGIAWALQTAQAATPLALDGAQEWHTFIADRWRREHARLVGASARRCRVIAALVRRPAVVSAFIRLQNSRLGASRSLARALAGELLAVQP
jgi:flavin-dependent dehydrogenase